MFRSFLSWLQTQIRNSIPRSVGVYKSPRILDSILSRDKPEDISTVKTVLLLLCCLLLPTLKTLLPPHLTLSSPMVPPPHPVLLFSGRINSGSPISIESSDYIWFIASTNAFYVFFCCCLFFFVLIFTLVWTRVAIKVPIWELNEQNIRLKISIVFWCNHFILLFYCWHGYCYKVSLNAFVI